MESFDQIAHKLNNGDFVAFDTNNLIFLDKNHQEHATNLIYDSVTNQIFPPDNFEEFIATYRQYVREVSAKVMLKNMGEIEEDILDANICWAVTDNMTELLSIGKPSILESDDHSILIPFMRDQLVKNKLLIILQDPDSQDHWFAVIGDNMNSHIVEHSSHTCNFSQTFTLNDLLDQMEVILSATLPDRFYGEISKHIFKIMSFNRKPLWSQTVKSFL